MVRWAAVATAVAGWLLAGAAWAAEPTGAAAKASVPARSGVGLNLGGWATWADDFPLVDFFKRSQVWLTQCQPKQDPSCTDFEKGQQPFNTKEQDKLDLDADGWVRSLPAEGDKSVKFRQVSALLFRSGGVHPQGRYVVLYDGKGTLAFTQANRNVVVKAEAGRVELDINDRNLLITLSEIDKANPVRNIRVHPPGGVCERNLLQHVAGPAACSGPASGKFIPYEKYSGLWHPLYLQDLRGFRALRFLDWTATNDSELVHWRDRPRLAQASWTGRLGVPVEILFDLARQTGADPWINLPVRVSDDYVQQFARLALERLPPQATLLLELGNEPWNYGFKASHWIREQAQLKWGGGKTAGTNEYALASNWYGWRSVQVCKAVKSLWGAQAHRVRCVLNAQAAGTFTNELLLACSIAAPELGKPCGRLVDALAIGPYFGNYIGDQKIRASVAPWFQQADGGLNRLFEEILAQDASGQPVTPPLAETGRNKVAGGALAQTAQWVRTAKALADQYQLPLYAYEGGQHLVMSGRDTDAGWLNLFHKANRDPRMGLAYTRQAQQWRDAGGQLFMYFNHAGAYSKHGAWGLKEHQFDADAAKWRAVQAIRDLPCPWPQCSASP